MAWTKKQRSEEVARRAARNYKGAIALGRLSFDDFMKYCYPEVKDLGASAGAYFDEYGTALSELEWSVRIKTEEEAVVDVDDLIESEGGLIVE